MHTELKCGTWEDADLEYGPYVRKKGLQSLHMQHHEITKHGKLKYRLEDKSYHTNQHNVEVTARTDRKRDVHVERINICAHAHY